MGSRNATMEDFETVLAAMRAGQVPTAALNTHRMPLAEVPTGFATLLDPAQSVVKALIEC
jgi:threonine dehydrogenase-like Zn-dependent dehydrogenase